MLDVCTSFSHASSRLFVVLLEAPNKGQFHVTFLTHYVNASSPPNCECSIPLGSRTVRVLAYQHPSPSYQLLKAGAGKN
jgi:hypothetical protein